MTSNFAIGGMVRQQTSSSGHGFFFDAGEYGVYEIISFRVFNGSTSVMGFLNSYVDTRYFYGTNPTTNTRNGSGTLFANFENIAPLSWVTIIDKNNPLYLWNNNSRTNQDTGGPRVSFDGSSTSTTSAVLQYRFHQNNDYSNSLEGSFGLRGTRIDQNWG